MASILKSLRGLADPTRLRILRLLREEDLSVAELQHDETRRYLEMFYALQYRPLAEKVALGEPEPSSKV